MTKILTSFVVLIALIGFVVYFLMLYVYAQPFATIFKKYVSGFKAKFSKKKNERGS